MQDPELHLPIINQLDAIKDHILNRTSNGLNFSRPGLRAMYLSALAICLKCAEIDDRHKDKHPLGEDAI